MRIILTGGAAGFVGSEVLNQALNDSSVDRTTVLTRRPVGLSHPVIHEIITDDFLDYSKIANHLKADACISCLGVLQTEDSRDEYIKITFDHPVAGARDAGSQPGDEILLRQRKLCRPK